MMRSPRSKRKVGNRKSGNQRPVKSTVIVDHLGHRGDGLAKTDTGDLFIADALPGEKIEVTALGNRAKIDRILSASPERIDPICPLFGQCGGCSTQHLSPSLYSDFKRRLVDEALKSRGIEVEVAHPIHFPVNARRRATFALKRIGKRSILGFHQARTDRVIELNSCPILVPSISNALPELEGLLGSLAPDRGEAKVKVLASKAGLDVCVEDANDRDHLALAQQFGHFGQIARLSVNGELIFLKEPPYLQIGKARVLPPSGGFTQASLEAEHYLGDRIAETLIEGPVADFHAGIGTFALRLAETVAVHAFEASEEALASLSAAARSTDLKPVTVERRDLDAHPPTVKHLNKFAGAVFDPPRAGAYALALQMARSDIDTIVAISCNPRTFARDARILIDGGYTLSLVIPVDQFHFTAHIEVLAVFKRG